MENNKAKKTLHIAIDGPAGAGKSSVAREIATRLGIAYLDTGAMYRVVAYKALSHGLSIKDEEQVTALAGKIKITFGCGENPAVYCDGKDVTTEIRSPEVGRAVSFIASYPGVRECLVNLQRQEAAKGSVVMDGRDIGTYVLPQAEVKIFLTASPAERAQRRHQENIMAGKESNYEEVLADIKKRDLMDTERKHAPLKPAPDAIILDTTDLSQQEVVETIIKIVREA